MPSVAIVYVADGHGSGFMAARGLLVTNYHVVSESRMPDVSVTFPDNQGLEGRRFAVQLVAENPVYDIAVLRIDCDVPPLRLETDYQYVKGQKIVTIGSPGTGGDDSAILPNLPTQGILGPPFKLSSGVEFWALSAAINAGNSGGPVIDVERGQVIGVATAKFIKTESQALAVPHAALAEMIRKAEAATAADTQRELAAHRARFCLSHMRQVLQKANVVVEDSNRAARDADTKSAGDRLEVFNRSKSRGVRVFSEEFTDFETVVSGEALKLNSDGDCDPSVRLAIDKLRETTTQVIAGLRKPIELRSLEKSMRDIDEGLTRAASLFESAARSLAVNDDDE